MSSDDTSSAMAANTANGSRRRSSFAGQFVDMFGSRPANSGTSGSPSYAGPITTAAAQAQQRRLSLTTVGLSGSPSSSTFGSSRPRGESISSSNSGTVDESPFEDGDALPSSIPTSPFARRLSFGARAMRDMRSSSGNGNANGQGFDFAENMRSRAERSSISAASAGPAQPATHQRAKSVAVMEPPVREIPSQPKRPDAFQERILKGDFYMD